MAKVLFYNIRLPRHLPFTTTTIDSVVFITKTNSDAVRSYSSDILPSGFVSSSPHAGGFESHSAHITEKKYIYIFHFSVNFYIQRLKLWS
jgi:hypothetical protein